MKEKQIVRLKLGYYSDLQTGASTTEYDKTANLKLLNINLLNLV